MKKTIFVVDDADTNLLNVNQVLKEEYRVFPLPSAIKMFAHLEKVIPDLILIDFEMPDMKGDEALMKLKEHPVWSKIPVIFMTGWNDDFVTDYCVKLGAYDFVHKPYSNVVLLNRVHHCLNYSKINGLCHIYQNMVFALKDMIDVKTPSAAHLGRSARMVKYLEALVQACMKNGIYLDTLNTWELDIACAAVLLYDLDLITIPESRLSRRKPLNEEDMIKLFHQTPLGTTLIRENIIDSSSPLWQYAFRFAYSHHENWNGSGYPNELSGTHIPLEGRILTVIDMYEKLRTGYFNRHYEKAEQTIPHGQVLSLIKQDTNIKFDPQIVEVMMTIEEDFFNISQQ